MADAMLRLTFKAGRRNNPMRKEMPMTRSEVKKVAWTLRLIGYGMLGGAVALLLLGVSRV
jgi:hypothetical protein